MLFVCLTFSIDNATMEKVLKEADTLGAESGNEDDGSTSCTCWYEALLLPSYNKSDIPGTDITLKPMIMAAVGKRGIHDIKEDKHGAMSVAEEVGELYEEALAGKTKNTKDDLFVRLSNESEVAEMETVKHIQDGTATDEKQRSKRAEEKEDYVSVDVDARSTSNLSNHVQHTDDSPVQPAVSTYQNNDNLVRKTEEVNIAMPSVKVQNDKSKAHKLDDVSTAVPSGKSKTCVTNNPMSRFLSLIQSQQTVGLQSISNLPTQGLFQATQYRMLTCPTTCKPESHSSSTGESSVVDYEEASTVRHKLEGSSSKSTTEDEIEEDGSDDGVSVVSIGQRYLEQDQLLEEEDFTPSPYRDLMCTYMRHNCADTKSSESPSEDYEKEKMMVLGNSMLGWT